MIIIKKKFGFHNFAEHQLRTSDLHFGNLRLSDTHTHTRLYPHKTRATRQTIPSLVFFTATIASDTQQATIASRLGRLETST